MTTTIYELENLDGWSVWTSPNPPKGLVTPELNIEDKRTGAHPLAVHNGYTSLRLLKHWTTWHGGIYRQVSAAQLALCKLSAWGRIWDVGDGVFPAPSDPNVHAYLRVGIDKTGGVSPTSGGVTWNEVRANDTWQKVEVQDVALTDTITIFVGFENGRDGMWDLRDVMGFLDTVEITVGEAAPPIDPPPSPGLGVFGIESITDMGEYWLVVARIPNV